MLVAGIIRKGVDKMPTVLGAGILGVAFVGLVAASAGMALTVGGELVSAIVAMAVAGRYA